MAFESITTGAITFLQVFANWNPVFSLLLISLFLGIISTLCYKYLTNQKLIKETKDDMKRLQEEMKLLKGDPNKMLEKQKELMQKNAPLMKESFKVVFYTIIPFGVIFLLVREAYNPLGKIAFGLTWFWIYFISSLLFSIILRKVLKVH
ncbi:MAG: EMC3/TMCO1 family protein [Nanoarchaeota archaeon]